MLNRCKSSGFLEKLKTFNVFGNMGFRKTHFCPFLWCKNVVKSKPKVKQRMLNFKSSGYICAAQALKASTCNLPVRFQLQLRQKHFAKSIFLQIWTFLKQLLSVDVRMFLKETLKINMDKFHSLVFWYLFQGKPSTGTQWFFISCIRNQNLFHLCKF